MNDSFDSFLIHADADFLHEMYGFLQTGFYLRAPLGKSMRETLLHIGFRNDYIDTRIKTIFRNSHPVDDMDKTCILDGDVLGLSGPMPGLVGAVLRSGSFLAPFRSAISSAPEEISESVSEGFIRLKVFNIVLKETGPFFLEKGIFLKSVLLSDFLREQNKIFFDRCRTIMLNKKKLEFRSTNSRKIKFLRDMVFLSVKIRSDSH